MILLFLVSDFVSAQEPLIFRQISTADGLKYNSVKAVLRDSLGFIWIGNHSSLSRFDGHEVKNYPILFDSDILSLEELNKDVLLIGTTTSLLEFDRKKNILTTIEIENLARVKAIKKVSNNVYLVGAQSGLYLINEEKKVNKITLDAGISASNHITSIEKENKDIYWFSTANGLVKYDFEKKEPSHYKMPAKQENSNYFYCLSLIDSTIYLGTLNKGVFSFDLKKKQFNKIPDFENDYILSMDKNGKKLYVGTDGKGIKVFSSKENKITEFISKRGSHSIRSNAIQEIKCYDDILWVGTLSGLDYSLPTSKNFSLYRAKDLNTVDYNVRSVFIAQNGDKFIGTRSGLIYLSEKKNVIKKYSMDDPKSGLRSDIILYINEFQGKVLIGTYGGGLYVFDEDSLSLKDFSKLPSFQHGCFFRFVLDPSGNLWFATEEGVLSCQIDGTQLIKYDIVNSGLVDNVVLFIYMDSLNRLFFSTHFGLCMMEPETGVIRSNIFEPKYNQVLDLVNYVMEDSQKNIWFCTNNGILKVNSDLVPQEYFDETRIPGNIAKNIIEDGDGNIWIATLNQIIKYIPLTNNLYSYGFLDGLTGSDFNNNVYQSSDGTIWWANEGGLIYTSGDHIIDSGRDLQNKPIITSYSVSDIEYDFPYMDMSKGIVLPSSDNNIRFKFSDMNYSLPYGSLYEYRLVGYDENWLKNSETNEVSYKDLPSGQYTFQLRIPGDKEQVQSVNVYVERSYVFIIGILLIVIVVIILVAYFCYRIWKLKRRMNYERMILSTAHEHGKGKKPVLPEQKMSGIMDNLLSYMEQEKPYLNTKISIGDVAAKLDCSETELSQLLNSHMNVNFANFINIYRVNEIKNRLNQDNLSKYTLRALSEQCGFSSKTTFYRVFKNITGMTPLEYCKKHNLIVKEN